MLVDIQLGQDRTAGRRVLDGVHHACMAIGVTIDDVSRIVVGVGPGGFTGLRIGLATAHALGQARACPVVGVCSLEGLAVGIARTARPGDVVIPAHDARRKELFAAIYRVDEAGDLEEILAPVAIAGAALAAHITPSLAGSNRVIAAGRGACVERAALTRAGAWVPDESSGVHTLSAADLLQRVTHGARPPDPLYARVSDAEVHFGASGTGTS